MYGNQDISRKMNDNNIGGGEKSSLLLFPVDL